MPFEGSAIARSVSAEYIAAARARSRSVNSSNAAAAAAIPVDPNSVVSPGAAYDTSAPPELFLVPSPVYGIPRRSDDIANPRRRSNSNSNSGGQQQPPSSRRTSSGLLGRKTRTPVVVAGGTTTSPTSIPEESAAATPQVGDAAPPASGNRSIDSQRTAGGSGSGSGSDDVDLERGEKSKGKQEKDNTKSKSKDEQDNNGGGNSQNSGDNDEDAEEAQEEAAEGENGKEHDPFLVTLKGREHLNPHTWNPKYRWFLTGLGGLFVLNSTFASSGPSQLIPSIVADLNAASLAGTALLSVFVGGYCVGPLLWGPLSERYGRKLIFIIAFVPYTAFQVGCALSPNIGGLLAMRFLSGCFAASPLTNSGGLIADLWDADRRGIALAIFSLAPFAGPAIAPIVSGVLEVKGADWRWIFWILAIFAGICLAVIVFVLPETYVPYILHKEAKRLRKETGDDRWRSETEHPDEKVSIKETLHHTVLKPFIMIVQEPMLLVLTLYLSFIYGIVYLLFEAIPIVFQEQHGWNALEGGLVFLALPAGGLLAVVMYALYWNKIYMKKHHAIKPKMVPPEIRLQPLMPASILFAIAFFIFAWTSYSFLVPVGPVVAVFMLGWAILLQFLSVFNYLIDTYLMNAASALAINTVCRSAFGAGFPLFASQMYARLGTPGASSLLGGLAIVFIPAPFVLYKYGRRVREMSKNAMVFD